MDTFDVTYDSDPAWLEGRLERPPTSRGSFTFDINNIVLVETPAPKKPPSLKSGEWFADYVRSNAMMSALEQGVPGMPEAVPGDAFMLDAMQKHFRELKAVNGPTPADAFKERNGMPVFLFFPGSVTVSVHDYTEVLPEQFIINNGRKIIKQAEKKVVHKDRRRVVYGLYWLHTNWSRHAFPIELKSEEVGVFDRTIRWVFYRRP